MHPPSQDLVFLTVRLHGRRSRMAEGTRLGELCRLRSLASLLQALYPQLHLKDALELQRRLRQDLRRDFDDCEASLSGPGARLLEWLVASLDITDLKVLARGLYTHARVASLLPHLVSLGQEPGRETQALLTSGTLPELLIRLPPSSLRACAEAAAAAFPQPSKPFFFEAALDQAYAQELLARLKGVSSEDKQVIQPLVFQEIDLFHLRLVVRGKFQYDLTPTSLLAFHLAGSAISRSRLHAMLQAPDLRQVGRLALCRVMDELPPSRQEPAASSTLVQAASLEALAHNRWLRLANQAFRRSHIGLAAVVGYLSLRRLEVANLITLSEALRAGWPAERIRSRLLPRGQLEPAYA